MYTVVKAVLADTGRPIVLSRRSSQPSFEGLNDPSKSWLMREARLLSAVEASIADLCKKY